MNANTITNVKRTVCVSMTPLDISVIASRDLNLKKMEHAQVMHLRYKRSTKLFKNLPKSNVSGHFM